MSIVMQFLISIFKAKAEKLVEVVRCPYFMMPVWKVILRVGGVDDQLTFKEIKAIDVLNLQESVTPWTSSPVGVILSIACVKARDCIYQLLNAEDEATDWYYAFGFGPQDSGNYTWADGARADLWMMPCMYVWKDCALFTIKASDMPRYNNEEKSDGEAFLMNCDGIEFMREAYAGPNITGGGQVRIALPVTDGLRTSGGQISGKGLLVTPTTSARRSILEVIDRMGFGAQYAQLTRAGVRIVVLTEDSIKLHGLPVKTRFYHQPIVALINKPASNNKAGGGAQERAFWTKSSIESMKEHLPVGWIKSAADKCFGSFHDADADPDTEVRLGNDSPVTKLSRSGHYPEVVFGAALESADGVIRILRNLFGDACKAAIEGLNKWDFRCIGLRSYGVSMPELNRTHGILAHGLLQRMGDRIMLFDFIKLSRSPSINPKGQPTLVRNDVCGLYDIPEMSYEEYAAGGWKWYRVHNIECVMVEGFLWAKDNMHHVHPDLMACCLQGDFDGDTVLAMGFTEYREPIFEHYEPEMEKYDPKASDQLRTYKGLWTNLERARESAMAIGIHSALFNLLMETIMSGRLDLDPYSVDMCRLGAGVNGFVDMVKKRIVQFHAFGKDLDSLNDVSILVWELMHPGKVFDGWKQDGGSCTRPYRGGYQVLGIGHPKRLLSMDDLADLADEEVNPAAAVAWQERAIRVASTPGYWMQSHCHSEIITAISECELAEPIHVSNEELEVQLIIKYGELSRAYTKAELDPMVTAIENVQRAAREFDGSWCADQANKLMSDVINAKEPEYIRALTLRVMALELNNKFKARTLSMTLDLATEDFWTWFFGPRDVVVLTDMDLASNHQ